MKKSILCMMMICIACTVISQTLQIEDTINITRERWRDTCFGLINKNATQIPSGYLVDYSLGIIDKDFDGISTNDTIKAYGDFFYYYNVLELSKVNSNAALQLTDDLFINAKRYLRDNPSIPLLFLFQPYQKINANALSNNLFSITTDSVRLMDVPNRPASPYDNKELFIFTPIQTNIKQHGNISFVLPSSFWQMPGINSVSIDFNDGVGFRTIAKNATASVYYATEGYKNITAIINTANGSRTAKCRIKYARPEFFLQPDITWNISVTPVYTDEAGYLGGSRTYNTTNICNAGTVFDRVNCDINPGANVTVINGCDQVFDRPIIIVEGFDTDNGIDIPELFARFRQYSFIDNMRSAGYDFVFVNLKKPLDFIENNAKVLEAVINQVNATKVGNIRGTVIGFSMGGLVARWCLKDMEDRSIDHKMAHYFSYDAPQQGANIPLGLQYLFGEIENDFSFLKWKNWGGSPVFPPFYQLVAAAHSAAARQMLVTKGNYSNGPFNWNPTLNTLDPLRAAFAQRLVQKGYPQNLTRHGIAFGRGNNPVNTKQAGNGTQFGNFLPGSQIFDGNVTWVLVNFISSAFAVQENGNTDYICKYRFTGYKVIRLFNINAGTLPVLRVRNFKYTGQYPYDDAPGSYETTQTQFVNQISSFNGLAYQASNEGHHGHAFVPTVSALDLQNQGYSSSTSWQSNNLFFNVDNIIVNPGQVAGNTINSALSPFNNVLTYTSDCGTVFCQSINDDVNGDGFFDIIGNNWNQFHNGFISNQASNYIRRKILNAVPGTTCPGLCNNTNSISGPPSFCTTANYELLGGNLSGLNIVWESENGTFVVTGGQGTANVTLSILANGSDFVRVTLTNACGSNRIIRLPISVGAPLPPVINGLNYDASCGTYVEAGCTQPFSATSYVWNLNFGQVMEEGSNYFYYSPLVNDPQPGFTYYNYLSVQARNTCGLSDPSSSSSLTVGPVPSSCGGQQLRVSPNPTSSSLTVETIDKSEFTRLKIIDKMGRIKKQFSFSPTNKVIIDVSNLPADFYSIQAFINAKWTTVSFIKQ